MISGTNKWNGNVYHASVHRNSAAGQSVIKVGAHKRTQHYFHVLDAACAPDMSQIATVHAAAGRDGETIQRAGEDAGTLRIWSLSDGEMLHDDPLPMPSEPRCVEYHPDGRQLAVCTARMEIVLVDTVTHKIEEVLKPVDELGSVISRNAMFPSYLRNGQLKFSPDGGTIAAWGDTDGLWVWDVRNRRPRFPCIENGGERVLGVAFSPDNERIAIACGVNQVARIVDSKTGTQLIAELEHAGV